MEKIIHYCWFGGKKKPRAIRKCIKSWKRFFSDFEIKEWNESNFDVNCCGYVKEAYKQKRYAFVSDYCRFYVLYKYGGIYLDTDVLVLKRFIDCVEMPFLAIERSLDCDVNPGLCCCFDKGDTFCNYMIEQYNHDVFSTKTVCVRATEYFLGNGFIREDKDQKIGNYNIYSSKRFCPIDYMTYQDFTNEETFAKHLYVASWAKGKVKLKIYYLKIKAKFKTLLHLW